MPEVWDAGGVAAALLLAHQGGWDEVLFVLLPIGLFAGLLAIANKRAARELEQRDAADDDSRRHD